MKQIAITLLLCLFCQYSFAQKVTGRWHSSKEVTEQVKMGYDRLSCSYKFKKSGKLIIKIEGEETFDHSMNHIDQNYVRRGIIRIKGTYSIHDGKITSVVKEDGIECYATEYTPPVEENNVNTASVFAGRDWRAANYQDTYPVILRAKLRDYSFLWNWDEEPYTVTGKELKIGERLVCKR